MVAVRRDDDLAAIADSEGNTILVQVGMRIGFASTASRQRDCRLVDAFEFKATDLLMIATTEEGCTHSGRSLSVAKHLGRRAARWNTKWKPSRCECPT